MRERIILAPGLNGTELTRSLALHGKNCIGLKVCGAAELARLALMRSGISVTEDFVSARAESAIAAEAVSGEAYFGKTSYSDVQQITDAIRQMRSLVDSADEYAEIERALSRGIFKEKNEALLSVYRKYIQLLSSKKAVDAVTLIRKAVSESKVLDAEFLTLVEYPLKPLERALLNRISGGHVIESSLYELFCVEKGMLHISSMKNCYGAPNEVETILEDIYAGKRLDECTVAVADTVTYAQLFFDYALLYDIPVSFGCGIPIVNSNPARLTALYYEWITGGFFGTEAIGGMLSSAAFNRGKLLEMLPERSEEFHLSTFYEVLGSLRLTNDRSVNDRRLSEFRKAAEEEAALIGKEESKEYKNIHRKLNCIPALEVAARELSLPAEEFIAKYAYIRKDSSTNAGRLVMMLDIAASRAIYEELKVIRGAGIEQNADDIIPNILRMSVCSQRSEAGKLYVTGIDGAFGAVRKNLYIAGMSASNYPGSPRENYLLLDDDLMNFGTEAFAYTSEGKIRRKRDRLLALAKLSDSLGAEVAVSFSGLNVSELKKDNPSSLIFELFREEHGGSATSEELEGHIRKVGYFEPAVSPSRSVGSAYTKGLKIRTDAPANAQEAPVPWDLDKAWSPTALDAFFSCPRRFLLKYLVGIPEPEDYDPFEIISAMDTGTLAHSLMEALGGTDMSREAFLALSGEYFDRFLKEHPPLIAENVPAVKEQFLEMMETAYGMDPHREVALEEEDICCMHESGVKIHGFPDRVERLDDGTYLIVDFKSGRRIGHVQDDICTCLQVIIYAYLMEQKGFAVSGGEYRYIRLGETVTCRYDENIKQQLTEQLTQFKDCMETGSFPPAQTPEGGDDPCRYCKYQQICGKTSVQEDTEEGGAL